MKGNDSLTLRFHGKRFDNHMLPMEMIPALHLVEKIVRELASEIYLREHPGAKRVPRGLRETKIYLKSIKEGSVETELCLSDRTPDDTDEDYDGYMRKAFDESVKIIERPDLVNNKPIGSHISENFQRIGTYLKDDEHVGFVHGHEEHVYHRSKMMVSPMANDVKTEPIEKYGRISAFDKRKKTCTIDCITGYYDVTRFSINLKNKHFDDDLIGAMRNDSDVYIVGKGVFIDGKLKRIAELNDFKILHPLDIGFRINEIMNFPEPKPNDVPFRRIDNDTLRKIGKILTDAKFDDEMIPYIFRTVEGNLNLEWKDYDCEMEVDMRTFVGIFYDFNDDTETTFDLNEPESLQKVKQILEGIGNE